MLKKLLPLFLVLAVAIWGVKAFFTPGFYTSHDGFTHSARIADYFLALKDLQIPPRWAAHLNGGMGSPIFIFIYPLPYFLGALLHFTGLSFTDSFKAVMGGMYVLSGPVFYLWLKRRFGVIPSILGAVFYVVSPYRFLLLFVRAAYAESIGYTFVPLALLAVDYVFDRQKLRNLAFLALSFAGILLSQNLVAVMFSPVIGGYIIVKFLEKPDKKAFIYAVAGLFWGFFISIFTYLPDLLELKLLHFGVLDYYGAHFVYFWQLLRSPWGYGFSFPGPDDGMSFQIGLAHISAAVLGMGLLAVLFTGLANKILPALFVKTDRKKLILPGYFMLVFFVSVFLMLELPVVHWLWDHFPSTVRLDYPWRFLGLSDFTAAVIAAWIVSTVKNKKVTTAVFALLFVAVLVANRNFTRINETVFVSDRDLLTYEGTATHLGEFTPLTRLTTSFPVLPEKVTVDDGTATISGLISNTAETDFLVTASSPAVLRVNILYFPGWNVYLDGVKVPYGKDYQVSTGINVSTHFDRSGVILVKAPAGEHGIKVKYEETPLRRTADYVSLAMLLIAGVALIL